MITPEQTDLNSRVVLDRRHQELVLLAAWQEAQAGLVSALATRDRLAKRRERAIATFLGLTVAELRWAKHHDRTGQHPTSAASRVNYAAYVHRRKTVEKLEAQWAERIAAAQVLANETAVTLCETTTALLAATTAQTVQELTGLTRRQVAAVSKRASAVRISVAGQSALRPIT